MWAETQEAKCERTSRKVQFMGVLILSDGTLKSVQRTVAAINFAVCNWGGDLTIFSVGELPL